MSLYLENNSIEFWRSVGSNSEQNYLTHSIFRYFGKLPPVLTGKILSEFVPKRIGKTPLVLDMMCGSGTTLVEAQRLNYRSIGIDANNIAILASRVKTSPIDRDALSKAIAKFHNSFSNVFVKDLPLFSNGFGIMKDLVSAWYPLDSYIPKMKNIEKWFSQEAISSLAIIRKWVEGFKINENVYNFLLISWLGIIRQSSNASVRTGRIFHDRQKKPQPVFEIFINKVKNNLLIYDSIPTTQFTPTPMFFLGDARTIQIELEGKADFTFFHPPYFALYKYSSDVLRFELEWGQFNRKEILAREIEDGFKTTNPNLMFDFVCDLVKAINNGFDHTKPGRNVGIVVSNSTLSEKQLPVIETLLSECQKVGIITERIIKRPVKHAQASYHKSANPNIATDSDYIIIFKKS